MKLSHRYIAVGFAALFLGITGCSHDQFPSYSTSIRYPLRHDPILASTAAKLGDERYEPDTPGQLPLMTFDDIFKVGNPMFPKAEEIKNTGVLRDPTKLSESDKKILTDGLDAIFGSPASPTVKEADAEMVAALKIDDDTLAKGSQRYRVHCLHCHGLPGDGRGPTAKWINPHPRDFRLGMFKFQSVDQATDGTIRSPRRADLLHTLRQGIEGTAMPSFAVLDDQELEWIVSYVIHLSIRGDVEQSLLKENFLYDAKSGTFTFNADEENPSPKEAIKALAAVKVAKWANSQKSVIKPAPYKVSENDPKALAASILRGKQLFTGDEKALGAKAKDANCVSCHVDYGRQAKFRFDDWGTLAKPNNFSAGVFRGGRRPIDIYYRIHSGINGSGMTAFGKSLNGDDIWDLVNFVSAMPYPAMRKDLEIK